MLSKGQTIAGQGGVVKKKKAPPRPPPPSSNTIKTSQSFRTAGELQSIKISSFSQRPSYSVDNTTTRQGKPSDLIDFSTPPGSPETARKTIANLAKEPADYMYRVGASVFYVKSQLKKSASSVKPVANPFSPPRPSAQALLASPAKQVGAQSSVYGNVPLNYSANNTTSTTVSGGGVNKYHPTIIKRLNENNNTIKSSGGGSVRSSSGSSDWSDYSQQSHNKPEQQQQSRYGNVPLTTWDEPPAQNPLPLKAPSVVVLPTIIKPQTSSKPKPSLLPKPGSMSSASPVTDVSKQQSAPAVPMMTNVTSQSESTTTTRRNYYDDPPDSDFDDEFNDDSFTSPPMPNEPPPPPPVDIALNDWVDSTQEYPASSYGHKASETDRAYAITLYDYLSDVEGDLPLQAGDLVYLMKKIDDEWIYGHCAGVEGMFPANFVNVVVPLLEEEQIDTDLTPIAIHNNGGFESQPKISTEDQVYFATALYKFDAETDSDLSLRSGDMVKIFGRLNEDWLYGEVAGSFGQFPSSFVDTVPSDLPIIQSGS